MIANSELIVVVCVCTEAKKQKETQKRDLVAKVIATKRKYGLLSSVRVCVSCPAIVLRGYVVTLRLPCLSLVSCCIVCAVLVVPAVVSWF